MPLVSQDGSDSIRQRNAIRFSIFQSKLSYIHQALCVICPFFMAHTQIYMYLTSISVLCWPINGTCHCWSFISDSRHMHPGNTLHSVTKARYAAMVWNQMFLIWVFGEDCQGQSTPPHTHLSWGLSLIALPCNCSTSPAPGILFHSILTDEIYYSL